MSAGAVRTRRWVPAALLTLAVFFWAGNWAIGRALRMDAPPVALAFWRWVITLLVLLPFTAREVRRYWPVLAGAWKQLAVLALLATVFQHIPVYMALRSTGAANGALLNAISPIFMVLLALVCFGDRLRPVAALGIMISLAGVVWIVSRGSPADLLMLEINSGDLWALGAAFSWASYTVCLRRRPAALPPLVFLATIALFGIVAMLPLYLLELGHGIHLQLTVGSLLGIAYIGVFATVIAYIFWHRGVHELGSHAGGSFMYLMPVFTAILAVVFLGEPLHAYHFIGTVLIFSGVFLTTRFQHAVDPRLL